MVDQDGRVLRFYTDLVKDQTVAIQFIFTSCTTICTPLGATFHHLQELTSGVDRRRLISISVDPEPDTPAELRKFADRFGARNGWTLVTGERVDIENLLKALRAFTQDRSAHSAMLLIGNDRTNRWTRAYGLSPAESLRALLREAAQGNK
ncbi:MAG: SCO family protein [Bryobacteraceae bacterium]